MRYNPGGNWKLASLEYVKRYSSCRYNERKLIDVTVVRRVRPRAERSCDFICLDVCVHGRNVRVISFVFAVCRPPLKPRLVEHTHRFFSPLKPRLVEHMHIYIYFDVALYCGVTQVGIRNSLRSNKTLMFCSTGRVGRTR